MGLFRNFSFKDESFSKKFLHRISRSLFSIEDYFVKTNSLLVNYPNLNLNNIFRSMAPGKPPWHMVQVGNWWINAQSGNNRDRPRHIYIQHGNGSSYMLNWNRNIQRYQIL